MKKLHSDYGITTDITTIARSLAENNAPNTTLRKTPLRNNHAGGRYSAGSRVPEGGSPWLIGDMVALRQGVIAVAEPLRERKSFGMSSSGRAVRLAVVDSGRFGPAPSRSRR